MKNRVINYKGYVISTEEGTERGIFFRNPLQKVEFDAYCDEPILSAWKYLDDIKNPIRRIYEILIGNSEVVRNVNKWSKDMNWAGFSANIICFPIYFKREYRKLRAVSGNKTNIQEIVSYGYESEFNMCGGHCDVEYTTMKLRNGKVMKFKRNEQYHFTYEHKVKEIIDTGSIK